MDASSVDGAASGDDATVDSGGDDAAAADDSQGLSDVTTDSGWTTCSNPTVSAPYLLDGSNCFYFVDLSCAPEEPNFVCNLSVPECLKLCTGDGGLFECQYHSSVCYGNKFVGEAGVPITVDCVLCPVGRRPSGLRSPCSAPARQACWASTFARSSHLEAASVVAFERLEARASAKSHRAPRSLLRMAARSARDEVRHARVTADLARRFGAEPASARVKRQRARSLEGVARENAVEGCVRETFGAMVATWQAAHASDERVRGCMTKIASDETRHAALAWAVAGWLEPRLSPRARARVAQSRRAAIEELRRDVVAPPDGALVREAGLPDSSNSCRLLDTLRRSIWV